MKWPFRARLGSGRFLKALLKEQHAQTLALQEIGRQIRLANQQDGNLGFVTGVPDGVDEAGLVTTTNKEILELLAVEEELRRKTGVKPSEEEVVNEWESRRGQ